MASEPPADRHLPDLFDAPFDTTRDAAGGITDTLVARWLRTARGTADARRLLGRYEVGGYCVVSDSAGLTRLSERLGLLEVLALIDRPKRILHSYGAALGGRAVGVWAADNAQMFFPEPTGAEALLSTLLRVRDEIARHCRIKIGVGVHLGRCYDLGGGLYGAEADAIEEVAENDTEGGEIAVSQAVVDRLPPGHAFVVRPKPGPAGGHPVLGTIHEVLDGPRPAAVRRAEGRYPIPYSPDFHTDLLEFERRPRADAARRIAARHFRYTTVVLVERGAAVAETPELTLLRHLMLSAELRATGRSLLPRTGGMEIKVAGPLAIYVVDDPAAAVRFALAFRSALGEKEITCRIGVDAGPVLVGEPPAGGRDIAGVPVNLASKMAQDIGTPGRVQLSETVRHQVDVAGFAAVRRSVSGVDLTFYEG